MKLRIHSRFILLASLLLLAAMLFASCAECQHRYVDGICEECGEQDPEYTTACSHAFSNGVCTKCGADDPDYTPPCSHSFNEGVCTKCGSADPDYLPPCDHKYENSVCTKCGTPCQHNYINGVCILCIKICSHSYEDGTCTECGTVCLHSYSQGFCLGCGIPCPHVFVDGVCAKCELPCPHIYFEGACLRCGADDPAFIAKDAGRRFYKSIIEKYQYLVNYKYRNEVLPPRGENEPDFMDALYEVLQYFTPTTNFGHSFKDINGDGSVELFLTENSHRIYAIFTLEDEHPALVRTFPQGMGYLLPDNTVFYNIKEYEEYEGSLRQNYLRYNISRLVGKELVGFSYGWEYEGGDYSTDNLNYYIISAEGEKTAVTYEEYVEFKFPYNYFWEYATRLTKLADLPFYPALNDALITEHTADFSTYEAIIKTFGLMHTELTDSNLSRSHYLSGRYDQGMIFRYDGDFVIYNKLLAASILAPSVTSADFGYAEKDLDGDGTDELIILDGNYAVLAIFTTVDGSPVLLDSYNDLRRAFIDAEGLIHVSERLLPGSENDFEYSILELSDGKLVTKSAVGITYGYSGEVSKTYKLVNGEEVAIEKSEYDLLLAEIVGVTENSSFEDYTKENSGLSFTSAKGKTE